MAVAIASTPFSLLSSAGLPVELRGGVHVGLFAPGTATFVFYAPFKPYVSLVGDFNQWDTRANRMVTDGQGLWWTTIAHPGATRYGYYVAIDEQSHAWVGDPYASQVEWSERGVWALLPESAPSFTWSDVGWQTPPLRELVIYELCVRDFAGYWQANQAVYGNFGELINYVPYFVELGVNALELMPIQAFPGDSSWGYNPVFYFAVANTYGSPLDFKRFVNECHRHGIAVILDVAFNHAWGEHPYYRIYPPLYSTKGERLEDWNPFFHHTPPEVNMWGGVDWDHFAPETTRYFQDVVRFWLQEYHVDGFRFDWAAGVDYDSRNPMQPGFDPYHGLSAIGWSARQVKPDCLLMAEYWPLEGTHPAKTPARLVVETPITSCWNGDFHHTIDDILNQRWAWEKKDVVQALGGFRVAGFTSAHQFINYSCSHDEVRTEHEIKYYSWSHIERPAEMTVSDMALAKALLGLIALLSVPGVPMIYSGQEFGEDAARTIDFQPLHWGKLIQRAHAEQSRAVTRLIAARRAHPALCSDYIEFYADHFAEERVVRYKRWPDAGVRDYATVGLNFGHTPRTITLEVPWAGPWHDVVRDKEHMIASGHLQIQLAPWSGILLVANCN